MSYRTYYAEIEQEFLPDPMLAPAGNKFSFIADPNRYKLIEIPLYRTGVIEGKVTLCEKEGDRNIGGVRLMVKGINRDYQKIIKTFADGTFYCMGILPGDYSLEVDPVQLGIMNAASSPQRIEFRVKTKAEGDFINNLKFKLKIIYGKINY